MITRIEWSEGGPVHLQTLDDQQTVLVDVPNAMTLREAARVLKKSRRHLYRYIERGWIKPLAKFSGEFFINPDDVHRIERQSRRQLSLPRRMALLFPDHDLKSLHLQRDLSLILTRVLERGTSADIRWIKRMVPWNQVEEFLKEEAPNRLSPKAQRFWMLISGVKHSRPSKTWRQMGRELGGGL